jgi:hypothetical protein
MRAVRRSRSSWTRSRSPSEWEVQTWLQGEREKGSRSMGRR